MSADLQSAGVSPFGAASMPPPSATPQAPGEAAFDRWLQRELSRLYDSALSEPVPDALMQLLRDAEKK